MLKSRIMDANRLPSDRLPDDIEDCHRLIARLLSQVCGSPRLADTCFSNYAAVVASNWASIWFGVW
jgi:hypothetical protein